MIEERKNFSVSCDSCGFCVHFDNCGETEARNQLTKTDGWLHYKRQKTERYPEKDVFVCPSCKATMQKNGRYALVGMLGLCVVSFLIALVARRFDY